MAVALALIAVDVGAQQTRSAAGSEADGKIATEIERRFDDDPTVNAAVVTIGVRNGVVTLNGRVANDATVGRAATVAAGVGGVTDVQNTLSVRTGARGRPGGPGSIPEAMPGSE